MNICVYPANTNGISIDSITKFVYNFVIKQGGVFMPGNQFPGNPCSI